MVQIIWLPRAIEDLNGIAAYIALDSPRYADLTTTRIIQKIEILQKFPSIGRVLPELQNETIRELIEGNFRIVYQVKSLERIEILTIHHSKRKLRI